MSDLKLPRLSSLWPNVERAPLPAALVAVLILALLLQLILPVPVTLPEAAVAPMRAVPLPTVTAEPATVPGIILRAPIFSPGRSKAGPDGGDGAIILIGTAGSRRGAMAVVRDGSGNSTMLRPGQSFGGWRLEAVGGDRAVFASPQGRRVLRIDETPAADEAADDAEEQP